MHFTGSWADPADVTIAMDAWPPVVYVNLGDEPWATEAISLGESDETGATRRGQRHTQEMVSSKQGVKSKY